LASEDIQANDPWWLPSHPLYKGPFVDSHAKSILRKNLRKTRKAFVSERLNSEIDFQNAHADVMMLYIKPSFCISGYYPVFGEASCLHLLNKHENSGGVSALPYIAEDAEERVMSFKVWKHGDPLTTSNLGFDQPDAKATQIVPDIILVPLLGFDKHFNRLGQGGGDYDRMFQSHPNAVRIGIAWSVQEVEAIPTEAWDVALDAVLTECEWRMSPQFKARLDALSFNRKMTL
jgi:5-formyltetrahydrofolate cyclo-ligase